MAEKRTINIDINNNADEAAKDFENFAKATNIANDSVEGLNKTFEEVYGELQPLTTRMGEAEDRLYELAAAGDTTSREYQELLTKVGEYRKVQIQTDLAVDQAAKTLSQKLGTALTGAASGFTAATGVIGLMGTESQELEKLLLKVNAAMAFQQGIEGIREYTKSVGLASKVTKVFNLIIAANPLAIFLTIITSIVASVLLFTDVLDQAIQKLKNLGDAIGLTNFAEEQLAAERQKRFEENIARYEEEQRQIEYTSRIRQQSYDNELSLLESLGKSTLKLRKQKVDADLEEINAIYEKRKLQLEELDNISKKRKLTSQEIEIQRVLNLGLQEGGKFQTERNALLIQSNKIERELANERKKNASARKKDLEEIAKLEQEAIDRMVDEEIALQQTFDKIQRENEDRFRTEQENEVLLVEEKYDALEAMAFGNAEALEQIEIARLNELNDVKQKFADEEVKIEKKKTEEIKEVEEATQEQKIAAVKNTLSTIANLAQLFAGESEREQKKAFKIQKAANIAQATIDTYASAVSSYNSLAGIPVVGPVLGGAAAAAAVTAGLLNIKSIAQQKFGGGVGDTPAVPSDIGGGGAPQFNVVGDSGVNQLAQLQQQPTQAYVVSGEVTTAQALDRNRVQNATL